jgi:hypothetical protein
MNKFDLEFINGYIKSTLRLTKKIQESKTLEEAKEIARKMEKKAFEKLEESMGSL